MTDSVVLESDEYLCSTRYDEMRSALECRGALGERISLLLPSFGWQQEMCEGLYVYCLAYREDASNEQLHQQHFSG
ncbi:hypothetical protein V6N13_116228 [Hibiscus sabdariffa]|uniref:Uncharacterized protein n=2 Tax=Hibiscus sabdariffa TaxID=183260 RepID=A0ABR2PC02_9ROSI